MQCYFSEWSPQLYVGSATSRDCPNKYWQGVPCWLQPRESGLEVEQGPGGVIPFPTLLGPVLVWSNAPLEVVENCEVFRDLGLLPGDPPRGKNKN